MTAPKSRRRTVPEVDTSTTSAKPATRKPQPDQSDQPEAVAWRRLSVPPTEGTPRPVPIPTDHHLDSGLVDYGMWVERSAQEGVIQRPPGCRRGRIWA